MMAPRGLSCGVWAALLLLLLLLLQASASPAGGATAAGQELPRASAPRMTAAAAAAWFLPLRRVARSTPFWRTVGGKPLGAHCLRGLECSTQTCRNGQCADPRVKA